MPHIHECPQCGTKWECGDANYQDECPFPIRHLCLKCWAGRTADTKEGPPTDEGKERDERVGSRR
jgi:hypothetical protein